MKKLVWFVVLSVVAGLHLQAQHSEGNPFARLGYTADVFTFGEEEEFHDLEEIVEIGDVLFNTKTDEVVGFVEERADSMIVLKPELQSMSIDPLCEKYYSISPYAYCMNNPIRCIDPDGKEVIGVTRNDAAKTVEDLRQMFQGDEFSGFRELIVQSGKKANGKNLASISSDALATAFNGISLTTDQQALVDMTVNTINSVDKHFIEYAAEDGVISSKGQSAFSGEFEKAGLPMSTIIGANGGIPVSLISNFGGDGLTVQTSKGTHSVIVGNNHPNGRAVTTGHEVIGHGRSLALGRGHTNQHVDAVQTENLILRVMGINYINNGSTHGPRTVIPSPSVLPGFR